MTNPKKQPKIYSEHDDKAVMGAIRHIMGQGKDAEIRQVAKGQLKIYEVEKHAANY